LQSQKGIVGLGPGPVRENPMAVKAGQMAGRLLIS
jgi:hypothetical protein